MGQTRLIVHDWLKRNSFAGFKLKTSSSKVDRLIMILWKLLYRTKSKDQLVVIYRRNSMSINYQQK